VFLHDPLLAAAHAVYWTEEALRAFLRALRCRCLFLRATDGWPQDATVVAERLACVAPELLTVSTLPGAHHLHLDPATAPAVAAALRAWLVFGA
jgi:pimeloyl-ACP methyl ester carboxylesterase